MSEFGGLLWKHQNNPACTESVKSLQNVEVGHYTEEEEIVVVTWCFTPSQPLRLYQGDEEEEEDNNNNNNNTRRVVRTTHGAAAATNMLTERQT